MKERMRHIVCCVGTAGVMTIMMTVPAMAAEVTEDKNINIEASSDTEQSVPDGEPDGYDWNNKAAANVLTYANIREGADAGSPCVGKLASGAVATVVGSGDGWLQVTSGEVDGYIREDLMVTGEEARNLYEAIFGSGEVSVEATAVDTKTEPTGAAEEETTAQAEADEASAQADAQQEAAEQQEQAAEAAENAGNAPSAQEVSVSTSELDLMAAIIECEAGGESYEGKVGVGAVIMNRIRSGEFPNTLSEVIYQSGQFEPVWTGKLSNVLTRGASEACYEAARDVYAGANTIGERLFFHAGGGSGLTIGNQTFY